ncbi:MAG TPA: methylated-DNA--[protein]-cysteine S-methyltransferase [Hyphomicrobiaceae bacterium]|nr:methylated-DNA--[protein]-cysteine S-methyltransferase [Hyphomicrobiaceae bacterium]
MQLDMTPRKGTATAGMRPDSQIRDYDLVRQAIAFLTETWAEQPSLEALAGHLALSPAHCQKLFSRWCGLSPKEFVQAITIDHARGLLAGSASVLDTAHEVGLSGPSRLHDLFVTHEAMTPGAYKRRGEGLEIAWGVHPSPFGLALAMATGRGICGLAFFDSESEFPHAFNDMSQRWPAAHFLEAPERTGTLLRNVFSPPEARGGEPIRLVLIGSNFEVGVWEALLRIPMGRAVSYSDLARHVGRPSAARAVGSAVGRNPISFVVPCHRVLRGDGQLGGYHWGLTRKRAIIGWERGRQAHPSPPAGIKAGAETKANDA